MSGFWERKAAERMGVTPAQPGPVSYPPMQPPAPTPTFDLPADPPPGQMHVGDAIHLWQGGPATRSETERCPGCGSGNYFSRSNGTVRGHAPAPHCYECGYPLVQFASELGAGNQITRSA